MIKFRTYRDGKDRQLILIVAYANHDVSIYSYKATVQNGQCTYLNSGLLMAPCKYVLHGLVPGMS